MTDERGCFEGGINSMPDFGHKTPAGYARPYLQSWEVPGSVHHAPVFVHFEPGFVQTERLLILAKTSLEPSRTWTMPDFV